VGRRDDRACPPQRLELPVEEGGACRIEARVRLVQKQEARLVEEGPAQREALHHAAREDCDSLVSRFPEQEPLEKHADPLAPLRHAVETTIEIEVLEGGQFFVEELLVGQVPDLAPAGCDVDGAARGSEEPRAQAEKRRLSRAVRPRHDEEVPLSDVEVETTKNPLGAETALKVAGDNHAVTSGCV